MLWFISIPSVLLSEMLPFWERMERWEPLCLDPLVHFFPKKFLKIKLNNSFFETEFLKKTPEYQNNKFNFRLFN